jgi:hypothetical protein
VGSKFGARAFNFRIDVEVVDDFVEQHLDCIDVASGGKRSATLDSQPISNSKSRFAGPTFPACLFCKASIIVNDKGRYHS